MRFLFGAPSLIGIAAWIDLIGAIYISLLAVLNWRDGVVDLISGIVFVALAGGTGLLGLWRSAGRRLGTGLDTALKASGTLHAVVGILSLFAGCSSNPASRVLGMVLVSMGISYHLPFKGQKA